MAASALPPSVPATPAPPIVHRAAAVVEWIDLEVEPRCSRYLTGLKPASVTFSLLYSEQQHEAALFIRVLLQQWTERKTEEQVYILIDLSNIILLMQDLEHSIPEKSTAAVLDGPTICLRLVLRRPVSIVGSSDLALQSSELLGSLELLARQTILAIHIPLSRVSNMEALQQICRAITGGSLRQDRRSIEGLCRGNAVTIIGRQCRRHSMVYYKWYKGRWFFN
ncbi:hypothetical protein M406DRAFT_354857 [Cryphonectria parasitica EP155]|uniref:Uncharacterized protein n=1 Tax=Cryphonectria parasitica (strain ATCC 38755 / EP155) TaxID=660469 RepID=A0A9P4Y784_CRYP1|nr:uncharacterized protein M406DRAFT_354857 [Cryphonectria parasitica EP155]KAF3768187.1 hypothetical protein M406DRAFT_354857 [Cryphonectria parasitica EP155]